MANRLALLVLALVAACGGTERDWDTASAGDTVAAYEAFLERHPDAEQAPDARRRIAELTTRAAFEEAAAQDTIAAYAGFLDVHASEPWATRARVRRAELEAAERERVRRAAAAKAAFEAAAGADTLEAYEAFLNEHADSAPVLEARAALARLRSIATLWTEALETGTIESFEAFLAAHPACAQADKAREKLEALRDARDFERARTEGTLEAFKAYLVAHESPKEWKEAWKAYVKLERARLVGYARLVAQARKGHADSERELARVNYEEPTHDLFFCWRIKTIGQGPSQYYRVKMKGVGAGDNIQFPEDTPAFRNPRRFGAGGVETRYLFEDGCEWVLARGPIKFLGHTFEPDAAYPLLFLVTKALGPVYLSGRGVVTDPAQRKRQLGAHHDFATASGMIRLPTFSAKQGACWAAGWLARSQDDRATANQILTRSLENADINVRFTAAEALARLADPAAVPALKKALAAERSRPSQRGVVSYRKVLEYAAKRCAAKLPPPPWPPPMDDPRVRVLVGFVFQETSPYKSGISVIQKGAGAVVLTERPGDGFYMPLSGSTGEIARKASAVPDGLGSEVRFGGSVAVGKYLVTAAVGERLCFKRDLDGWVYLCGRGKVESFMPKAAVEFGAARTVDVCVELLSSKDPILREGAARDLGRLTIPPERRRKIVEALGRLLAADRVPDVRSGATEAIGLIGSEFAMTVLAVFLDKERDADVKKMIRAGLAMGSARALLGLYGEKLRKKVDPKDAADQIRETDLAWIQGVFGRRLRNELGEEFASRLQALFESKLREVRFATVKLARIIGDSASVAALRKTTEADPDKGVRDAASKALRGG